MKAAAPLVLALLVAGAAACAPVRTSEAQAATTEAVPGGEWFKQTGCTDCHSVSAYKMWNVAAVGPDLSLAVEDVPKRFGRTLEDFQIDRAAANRQAVTARRPPALRAAAASSIGLDWSTPITSNPSPCQRDGVTPGAAADVEHTRRRPGTPAPAGVIDQLGVGRRLREAGDDVRAIPCACDHRAHVQALRISRRIAITAILDLGERRRAFVRPLLPVGSEQLAWMLCSDGAVAAHQIIRCAVAPATPANPLGMHRVENALLHDPMMPRSRVRAYDDDHDDSRYLCFA